MSPRTPQQNERLRAASREKIVEHALRLFATHGYERTSVKMIAEAAGVSQGLLYNYFEGKDALLRAIFEASMEDVRASFAAAEAEPDPRRRVEALLRGSFAIVRRNLHFWRLSYGVRMQAGVLEALGGARLQEWTAAIRATLERYLRDAGVPDPGLEAAILFALIDGVSQHYVLDPDNYPLDEVMARIIARYDGG
ncbi:MAG TPA: TetR/AcrR family transcriptional regulator [Longimicrobium sp.]|nr:TetR/AcrR family transcriptional regulator [Longimicrobium sp.]